MTFPLHFNVTKRKDRHTKHNYDISQTYYRTLEFSFSVKNLYHNENISMTCLLYFTVMWSSCNTIILIQTILWYFKDILIAQLKVTSPDQGTSDKSHFCLLLRLSDIFMTVFLLISDVFLSIDGILRGKDEKWHGKLGFVILLQ